MSSLRMTTAPTHSSRRQARLNSADPRLKLALLNVVESEPYTGDGRNIFRSNVDIPRKPNPSPKPDPSAAKTKKQPSEPHDTMRLFGYAIVSGSSLKACLIQEGEVFIGSEGEIVDRRYKIKRVLPNSVQILDLWEGHEITLTSQE